MEDKVSKLTFQFSEDCASNDFVMQDQKNHLIRLNQAKSTLRSTFSQASVQKERPMTVQRSRLNRSSNHSSRIISQENAKMFRRLLQAKPTIKYSKFLQVSSLNKVYKENLVRSRYKQPDYTIEARKMLRGQKNKLKHLSTQFSYDHAANTAKLCCVNIKSKIINRKQTGKSQALTSPIGKKFHFMNLR